MSVEEFVEGNMAKDILSPAEIMELEKLLMNEKNYRRLSSGYDYKKTREFIKRLFDWLQNHPELTESIYHYIKTYHAQSKDTRIVTGIITPYSGLLFKSAIAIHNHELLMRIINGLPTDFWRYGILLINSMKKKEAVRYIEKMVEYDLINKEILVLNSDAIKQLVTSKYFYYLVKHLDQYVFTHILENINDKDTILQMLETFKDRKYESIMNLQWLYKMNDPEMTRYVISYILDKKKIAKPLHIPVIPTACILNLNNPDFDANNRLFINYGIYVVKNYNLDIIDIYDILEYIGHNDNLQFLPFLIYMMDMDNIDIFVVELYRKAIPKPKIIATVLLILQQQSSFKYSDMNNLLPLIYKIVIFALINYCTMYQYLQWYYYHTPLIAYKHTKKGIIPIEGPILGPKMYTKYDKFLRWDIKAERNAVLNEFNNYPQNEFIERNILNELTKPFITNMINYLVKLLKNDRKYVGYAYLALTRSKNFENNDMMMRVADHLKKYVLATKK